MKLTHLIAQFLYKNKRLDLQGIGSFLLEKSIVIESEKSKNASDSSIEGITFENNQQIKEDPELIAFISGYTGKIKALAAADLNSHLELAKQFLNIGKPFLFEGIGSLSKNKTGEYIFIPGNVLTEKLSEQKQKHSNREATNEEPVSDFKSALYKQDKKSNWKKPVTFLLVIVGVVLAIWGGYTVYKKTSENKTQQTNIPITNDKTILLDDSTDVSKIDSTIKQPLVTPENTSGSTKFVLEVANQTRAFQRYSKLKTFLWDVKLETKDSVSYKLYILIPSNASDTSRIVDSLTLLNGKRVYVEN